MTPTPARPSATATPTACPFYAAANSVTPDGTLSAQYPNYPQEFRFTYTNVPTSGSATINVRLKEFATAVYPNRLTTLTRTVNTLAPAQVVTFATPPTNGVVLTDSTNLTYKLQACFTASLTSAKTNFNILINGVLQPQGSYVLQPTGGTTNCPGMKTIQFTWNNPPLGTNLIQIIYTNAAVPNQRHPHPHRRAAAPHYRPRQQQPADRLGQRARPELPGLRHHQPAPAFHGRQRHHPGLRLLHLLL